MQESVQADILVGREKRRGGAVGSGFGVREVGQAGKKPVCLRDWKAIGCAQRRTRPKFGPRSGECIRRVPPETGGSAMNPSATLETTPLETPANEVMALKAGIAQHLTEVEQLREQMSRDQVEIDCSKKRTRVLLAELRVAIHPAGREAA